jgi:hypothetical protein
MLEQKTNAGYGYVLHDINNINNNKQNEDFTHLDM